MTETPLWRQAFDAAEKRVTPHAEELVRTPGFAVGVALVSRARSLARGTARGLSARAWHLVNLPAGTDVSRLRAQVGALDREVRRLTVQLETERRSQAGAESGPRTGPRSTTGAEGGRRSTETSDADGAQPTDDPRPRPARRRTQRPAGS